MAHALHSNFEKYMQTTIEFKAVGNFQLIFQIETYEALAKIESPMIFFQFYTISSYHQLSTCTCIMDNYIHDIMIYGTGVWELQSSHITNQILIHFFDFMTAQVLLHEIYSGLHGGHQSGTINFFQRCLRKTSIVDGTQVLST